MQNQNGKGLKIKHMEVNKMPGGDRTGPRGIGPMTGRQAGYCAGYNTPGYANLFPRRRFFGRGLRCFGWRRWDFAPGFVPGFAPIERVVPVQNIPVYPTQPQQLTKEQEITMLENDAKVVEAEQKALNQELEEIKKRIEELRKEK